MAYILPQVQVFQEFGQLPQNVVNNLNAFVFGPHYQLFRYSDASEKALINLGAYNYNANASYSYPQQPAGSTVDLEYVKLIMENVWAQYALIGASETTPLVAVSDTERNKLRAMPRIETADYLNTDGDEAEGAYEDNLKLSNGIGISPGGYIYNSPSIPENFYFFPNGSTIAGSWELVGTTEASLEFVTFSEGQVGTVALPSSDNPLSSNITFQGPYGMVLDIDSGTRTYASLDYSASALVEGDTITIDNITFEADLANDGVSVGNISFATSMATVAEQIADLKLKIDQQIIAGAFAADIRECVIDTANEKIYIIGTTNFASTEVGNWQFSGSTAVGFSAIRKPVVLKIGDSTSYFTVTVDPDALPNIVDEAIELKKSLKFKYTNAGPVSVTWNNDTQLVDLALNLGVSTIAEVRAQLVGESDIAAVLDMGPVNGNEDAVITAITDETGASVTAGFNVFMLPDAYRVRVLPNQVTWKTGNGFNRSAIFKSRDVQVGDRIRYSVVGSDSQVYTGTSKIASIETDTLAAYIEKPSFEANNDPEQVGNLLSPHVGLDDIIIPGSDNQRRFNGAKTALYALSSNLGSWYYPGDYSTGTLSEKFNIEITTGGLPGAARATVTTESGNYIRTNVPITQITWTEFDALGNDISEKMGMITLGQNLFAVLHQGSTDADAKFQVGDEYTFDYAVKAPWSPLNSNYLSKTGNYTGPVDTTYVLEVTRGGVFNRKVTVTDGMITPNQYTLDYNAVTLVDDETFEVGGVGFEFDTSGDGVSNPGYTEIDSSGSNTPQAFTLLAKAINSSSAPAYASNDEAAGVLTIRGSSSVISGITITDGTGNLATNGVEIKNTATLTSNLDWDANEWSAGDIDDEYVLRVTKSGTLTTARFQLTSQRGDNLPDVTFDGDGIDDTQALGSNGLSVYWTLSSADVVFNIGDEWTIAVNGTRPQVTIVDTAGIDQSSVEVVNDGDVIDLGLYGAQVTFASNANTQLEFGSGGGLNQGDVYYVVCRAAAPGAFQTLVLSDDLPANVTPGLRYDLSNSIPVAEANFDPSEFTVWLYLVQAWNEIDNRRLQSPPDYNWTASESEVTVNEDIEVQDPSWYNFDGSLPYLPVYKADLFVEYRALMSTYTDTVYSLNDISDVVTTLGTVNPDNPLAQGVFNALSNSGDQPVYFMGVPSNDLEGYSAVLDKAEKTDLIYGLAPLSRDRQILTLVEGHVNDMSSPEEKKWRIAFVGSELPTEQVVYNSANHPTGGEYKATVQDDPSVTGAQFTIVTFDTDGETQATADIRAGDTLRINFATDAWGTAQYKEYKIASILSNTKVKLATGAPAPINTSTKVEVWHTRSTAEIANAVAALSEGFANRRVYHVFPDKLYLAGVAQNSEFAAASLVGLVSSAPPQQGLTNIEVNGFDDVPGTYSIYTAQQLNIMAGSGTFILMQDYAGGKIYVRHQVSTATSDGNLLTTELSITKNLDAISYYFVGVLTPYIGRYNITPELLDQLYVEVNSGLNFLSSAFTSAGLLGPMVIRSENTAIRTLEQHPTLRDHVVIIVDLVLPVPLNVIQLRLVV